MRRLLVLFVSFTIIATACGDDGDGGETPTTEPAPVEAAEPEPAPVEPSEPEATEPEPEPPADADTPSNDILYADHVTEVYDDPAVWVCWPGADDVCAENQDLTLVSADGTLEVVPFDHVDDAPVDCFYVYPTVSNDESANSDLIPQDDEEVSTTRSQAARYGEVCRVFAPVYRQVTLGSLFGAVEADDTVDTRAIAYDDVLDAFKHYMSTANEGRGVVLLGHSQGAGVIRRLIAEEIDGNPDWDGRLVGAHILGSSVDPGPDGSFATIPECGEIGELGCVVSFASFRETAPPPENSFFGRADRGPALCTNPADLAGGPAMGQAEFVYVRESGRLVPLVDEAANDAITTPWVGFPDFLELTCVDDGTFGYLEVVVQGDPDDARVDDIRGDLTPQWGLHLVDAQVALGDLVDLLAAQVEAYSAGAA